MTALLVACVTICGLLGLLIGSFLNVVVWRLPRGESLSHPGSHCPQCGHAIRWWDNVPVVSWAVLRGRCRDCSEPISTRYPLVELATGFFFAGVALWVLRSADASGSGLSQISDGELAALSLTLLAFLYLAAITVALALIDLETHTLPNKVVLPAYIVAGALLAAASILVGDWAQLLRAAIAMAAMFIAYLVMAIAYPGGMGFGDVKLAGVLGLYLGWLGWGSLLIGAFAAFVLGGLFSVILLALRKATRKSGIPFGPWMLVGAWVGIFLGEFLWQSYLSLFGLSG